MLIEKTLLRASAESDSWVGRIVHRTNRATLSTFQMLSGLTLGGLQVRNLSSAVTIAMRNKSAQQQGGSAAARANGGENG